MAFDAHGSTSSHRERAAAVPLGAVLRTTRPSFLLLPPVCVLLGIASAKVAGAAAWSCDALLALAGALLAHVSVNTFNEYFDFRSGLDAMTVRTPFSGGSGALPAHPRAAPAVLAIAVTSLGLTAAIGIHFLATRGIALLPIGLLGLLLVVAYTNGLARNPWLCLISPGLGFGPLMVIGTQVAITGTWHATAVAASLPVFFLFDDLLLLNQFPDIEADRKVGRRHLAIVHGKRVAARVYTLFILLAYVAMLAAVAAGALPASALLGLLTLPLGIATCARVLRHADDVGALLPAMRLNVVLSLATPALMAFGMLMT